MSEVERDLCLTIISDQCYQILSEPLFGFIFYLFVELNVYIASFHSGFCPLLCLLLIVENDFIYSPLEYAVVLFCRWL